MQQLEIIKKLNHFFEQQREIDSCLLIGSFGRKDASVRSDIDIQIILNPDFSDFNPIQLINKLLKNQIQQSFYLEEKNKIVLYLNDEILLCEIFVYKSQEEVNKYFLGSEIDEVSNAILFDKTGKLKDYLNYIRVQYKNKKNKNRLDEIEKNLIEFQYRFESCSSAHAKSDGYKFYLLYNNALNCLVRMIYWANDGMDYSYLPPDFLTRYGHSINFLEHDGSMFLPKGNEIKRRLLDRLAYVIPILTKKYQIKTDTNAILSFCERVYNRDYFWNFRDIATYNPYLKHNIVFRSTSLTKYQDEIAFVQLQNQYGIKHIIDLRTDDEVEECQYKEDILNSINYIRACIDPRIQSDSFKSRYNTGTNVEIAYAYYAVECCGQIRLIADSILKNEGATVIHCVAGRDRTGIIISLLHLLSGAGIEIVYNDYLASGQNTNKNDLKIFLNIVQETGGIIQYLKHCGLTEKEILHLKSKITL